MAKKSDMQAHIEETLLKFFYGECTMEELKLVHKELCDDDKCHEYLQKVRELLRVLRESEASEAGSPASWDDVKGAFEQVSRILETGGK